MSILTEGNDTDVPDSKRPNVGYELTYSMIFYRITALQTPLFKNCSVLKQGVDINSYLDYYREAKIR